MTASKRERDVNTLCSFLNFNTTWEADMGDDFLRYRRAWQENTRHKTLTRFPMHLDFDLTNACTLACPFCPRTQLVRQGRYPGTYRMPFEVYEKALREGAEKGLLAINLNAGGEPLLHPDLPRMVKLAADLGILDIMLHTSAVHLDEAMARSLIEGGLTKLIISFDSPIPEHYEQLRKNARFDAVVANINRAIDLKKELRSLTPFIRINMVQMKENHHERQQMIDFWRERIDGLGFLEYINYYQWDDRDRYVHPVRYQEDFVCEKPWQRLGIAHDGRIKFCHLDDLDEVTLGTIIDTPIEEAWQGAQMQAYRELQQQGRIREIDLCSRCSTPMMPEEP
ncbi:radical SAM protein [Geothermobacter hydrogeniphilus]|uniref:Radical SAM core domain-containing protein n=1 Tax=Geothermobacter hydrogeniphilus TaxID=1969733 RepID=A0A1X0YEH0_9BACT|nr:radical SAM protein [Geothermobacter hydrogeniphilus]ORJ63483.1 hypothetical protein B5V00_01050 [Geothermobacter hydrogeniphilus]